MIKNTMPYVYFQGGVIPSHSAKISLASHSLQYGTTCFGGIRGYHREGKARLFRLQDHHERLMDSAKMMEMRFHIPYNDFLDIIQELIRKNRPDTDFYIRPFLFSQDEQLAPKPLGLTFELGIYLVPLGNYFDPAKGLKMMTSSWRKFPDSSLPTKAKAGGCYVNSYLATAEAMRSGYDEALLMDQEGYIVEASVANIAVCRRGRVSMPPIGAALLEGITMRTAIEMLAEEGISVHHEKIDKSMVYTCDELLALGTAAQAAYVHSVDGKTIGKGEHTGPGPVCTLLRSKFQSLLDNKHPKSPQWVTEVGYG